MDGLYFVSVHPMHVRFRRTMDCMGLRVPCRCEIPCVLTSKLIGSTCVDNSNQLARIFTKHERDMVLFCPVNHDFIKPSRLLVTEARAASSMSQNQIPLPLIRFKISEQIYVLSHLQWASEIIMDTSLIRTLPVVPAT